MTVSNTWPKINLYNRFGDICYCCTVARLVCTDLLGSRQIHITNAWVVLIAFCKHIFRPQYLSESAARSGTKRRGMGHVSQSATVKERGDRRKSRLDGPRRKRRRRRRTCTNRSLGRAVHSSERKGRLKDADGMIHLRHGKKRT